MSRDRLVVLMDLMSSSSLVTIGQVPGFPEASWCSILLNVPPNLTIYFMIPRFVLSVVLFILAVMQTLKQSVAMYKATKQWQPNRYMVLLVQHGIIYFFTYVDHFLRLFVLPVSHSTFPDVLCFCTNNRLK